MSKLEDILRARKEKAQDLLSKTSTNAWLVISQGNDPNLEYLLGAHPHNTTIALLTKSKLQVMVSQLEESLIPEKIDEIITYYGRKEFLEKFHTVLNTLKGKSILLDNSPPFLGTHASTILSSHEKMVKSIGKLYGINFKPAHSFVRQLRRVKSENEHEALRFAVKKTLTILDNALKTVRRETTEKALSAEIYRGVYTYGTPAFDPIVAFGDS